MGKLAQRPPKRREKERCDRGTSSGELTNFEQPRQQAQPPQSQHQEVPEEEDSDSLEVILEQDNIDNPSEDPTIYHGKPVMLRKKEFVDHEEISGEGGTSQLFRGENLNSERNNVPAEVAIKRSRTGLYVGNKEQFDRRINRFFREVRLLGRLDHIEALPTVYGSNTVKFGNQGYPQIIMELIDGEPLSDYVAQDNEVEDILDWAQQLYSVAGELHDENIIHRDFKPGNAMIQTNGMLRLLDLGGSTEEAESTISQMIGGTINRTIAGTPKYESIEASWGYPVVQSDIYSIAVTLYDLLSEKPSKGPRFRGAGQAILDLGKLQERLYKKTGNKKAAEMIVGIMRKVTARNKFDMDEPQSAEDFLPEDCYKNAQEVLADFAKVEYELGFGVEERTSLINLCDSASKEGVIGHYDPEDGILCVSQTNDIFSGTWVDQHGDEIKFEGTQREIAELIKTFDVDGVYKPITCNMLRRAFCIEEEGPQTVEEHLERIYQETVPLRFNLAEDHIRGELDKLWGLDLIDHAEETKYFNQLTERVAERSTEGRLIRNEYEFEDLKRVYKATIDKSYNGDFFYSNIPANKSFDRLLRVIHEKDLDIDDVTKIFNILYKQTKEGNSKAGVDWNAYKKHSKELQKKTVVTWSHNRPAKGPKKIEKVRSRLEQILDGPAHAKGGILRDDRYVALIDYLEHFEGLTKLEAPHTHHNLNTTEEDYYSLETPWSELKEGKSKALTGVSMVSTGVLSLAAGGIFGQNLYQMGAITVLGMLIPLARHSELYKNAKDWAKDLVTPFSSKVNITRRYSRPKVVEAFCDMVEEANPEYSADKIIKVLQDTIANYGKNKIVPSPYEVLNSANWNLTIPSDHQEELTSHNSSGFSEHMPPYKPMPPRPRPQVSTGGTTEVSYSMNPDYLKKIKKEKPIEGTTLDQYLNDHSCKAEEPVGISFHIEDVIDREYQTVKSDFFIDETEPEYCIDDTKKPEDDGFVN